MRYWVMQHTARAAVAVIVLCLAACTGAAQSAAQSASDVVATVGSARFTLAEIDERAMKEAAGEFGSLKLGQAIYEARRAALDDMIGTRLLDAEAKMAGVDRATLVEREITSKIQ